MPSRIRVAGADSIEDMALLRHGGMGRVFTEARFELAQLTRTAAPNASCRGRAAVARN
jgi:hypothetical protein